MIRRSETSKHRTIGHRVTISRKLRAIVVCRAAALLCLTALARLVAPSPAEAAGTIITRSGAGVTITVSTEWLDTGGYRPVFFEIVTAPSIADMTVHVEFKARELRFVQRELLVKEDIEIPAGSTRVLATLSVPQVHPWQYCDLDVWVDGKYQKKLSQQAVMVNNSWAGWQETAPNVVAVFDATAIAPTQSVLVPNPDATELVRVLPADVQNQFGVVATPPGTFTTTPAAAPAATALAMPTLISMRHDRLPTRWLDYSGIDIVCIPFPMVERLAASEPARWRAIRDWAAAGGNLIVSGAGDDFAALAALDRHLQRGDRQNADDTRSSRTAASASGEHSEWRNPSPANHTPGLNDANSNGAATVYTTDAAGQVTTQVIPNMPLPAPERMPFRLRALGSGVVIAASVPDVFQQKSADWAWMLNSLTSNRWLWFRRNGLSLERANPGYWDWLVQGVGLAPVTEFRVLITLFVLAIGPINYFWLRRRQKLHLLVIIVPLAALAVTGTLFTYALFADGLAIRVRTRSLTLLDQRDGQAVCWSRMSYYAGLSPSGGLRFPTDMAIYPLWSNDDDNGGGAGRQSTTWTPERQELTSGWIASRTPTQFVTARTRTSEAAVVYLGKRGAGETWIENRLGTRIERLLLADEAGRLFRAADIAPGERKALSPTTNRKDEAEVWRLVSDRRPAAPPDFVDRDISGFSYRRRMIFYPQMNNQISQPTLESGRLEAGMRAAVTGSEGDAIYNQPPDYTPPPRSYVAIVERSPEVDYGVSEPREEDSLHVVVGKW